METSPLEVGRILAAKRAEQVAVARAVQRQTAILWRVMQAADLQARHAEWVAAQTAAIVAGRRAAATSAAKWYNRQRIAETGQPLPADLPGLQPLPAGGAVPAAALQFGPDLAQQIATSLRVTGPVRVKRAIAAGNPVAAAMNSGLTGVTAATQRLVLDGGREAEIDLIGADPLVTYYARVASPTACSFCKMLASRGPVYTATSGAFRSHDGCDCGLQPVFRSEARRRVNTGWPGRKSKVTVYPNRVDLAGLTAGKAATP
jgi:hypothetical protein